MVGMRSAAGVVALVLCATIGLLPSTAAAIEYYQLNGLSFADASHGYIAGGYALPATPGDETGVVSRTTDGGRSWHASIVSTHVMSGVRASSDANVAAAMRSNFDGLYSTSSGGASWASETPLFGSTDPSFFGLAYLSGDRRVLVGERSAFAKYAVLGSAVGAGSWDYQYQGPIHPAIDPDPAPATYANFVAVDEVPGGNVAWAVGNDYQDAQHLLPQARLVQYTSDGGSTWATQSAGAPAADLSCVSAVDSQTAFIGTKSRVILRTVNGGATWDSPSIPSTSGVSVVNAIDAFDANHAVVVGAGGKIAWTSNLSSPTPTWASTTQGTSSLTGVQMLSAEEWIAVGHNETIVRTIDGGAHWTGQTTRIAPTIAITSPTTDTILGSTTILASGTASDGAGIGVAQIDVRVQRGDDKCWDGVSAWVADTDPSSWLPATSIDGWDTWSRAISIDSTSGAPISIVARATDGVGATSEARVSSGKLVPQIAIAATPASPGYGATAYVSGTITFGGSPIVGAKLRLLGGALTATSDAAGHFSFAVRPSSATWYWVSSDADATYASAMSANTRATPLAYVGRPVVPSWTRHTKSFKVYADLKPRHAAGSAGLTFYFDRYQRMSNGKYSYVRLKTVSAKAANYSSWSRSTVLVKLKAGKWRVQAKHADAGHAVSYSVSMKYFTVR